MLLGIYLGTTAISLVTALIFSIATKNKLKRKGYKFIKKEESFSEKLASTTSTTFKMLFPVYNILNAICILWFEDKFYNYMEEELLKSGEIYMDKNKKENDQQGEEISKPNNNIQKNHDEINSKDVLYEYTNREGLVNLNNHDLTSNLDKQNPILKRTLRPKK